MEWVSEQLEMKSNEVNQTVQMTHMSVRELKDLGYEIISSTFAYKPKLLAGLAGSSKTAKHLRLDKRKVRWCLRGCDHNESYPHGETYAATPGYHCLRIIIVLALEAGVIPQQADVVSAFQIPPLHAKIAVTMPKGFLLDGMSVGICAAKCAGITGSRV